MLDKCAKVYLTIIKNSKFKGEWDLIYNKLTYNIYLITKIGCSFSQLRKLRKINLIHPNACTKAAEPTAECYINVFSAWIMAHYTNKTAT